MNVGERIQLKMKEMKLSQNRLAKAAQISQSGLSSIIAGAVSPKEVTLQAIARALDCSVSELMGETAPGVIQMIQNAVPIVGTIACGEKITATQNLEGYADLPDGVHADFALRCKGDSMSPTFESGDLVLIRQQPEVSNGQIAAVGIGDEALLKHVYYQENGITCVSDNPEYPPMFFSSGDGLTIYGLAVGYVRMWNR